MSEQFAKIPDQPALTCIRGSWTYRSWRNNPDAAADSDSAVTCSNLKRLLFLEASLELSVSPELSLEGYLRFDGENAINIRGQVAVGNVLGLRFQASGTIGVERELLVYDYTCWLVPAWPYGVDQSPSLVGSVIRTISHSGGQAKAGYVASFYAVKNAPM